MERSFSNKPVPSGKIHGPVREDRELRDHSFGARHGAAQRQPVHVSHGRDNAGVGLQVPRYAHEPGRKSSTCRRSSRTTWSRSSASVGPARTSWTTWSRHRCARFAPSTENQFHVHNAYRSPGRLMKEELRKPKSEVYERRYTNFRTGLSVQRRAVDDTAAESLDGVTFAFVCVDKGSSRATVFDLLIAKPHPVHRRRYGSALEARTAQRHAARNLLLGGARSRGSGEGIRRTPEQHPDR